MKLTMYSFIHFTVNETPFVYLCVCKWADKFAFGRTVVIVALLQISQNYYGTTLD